MNKIIVKKSISDIVNTILIVLFIMSSSGFWFLTFNALIRSVLGALIILIILAYNFNNASVNVILLINGFIFFILLSISFVFNLSQFTSYSQVLLSFNYAIIISSCYNFKYFIKIYIRSMVILSAFSLLVFLINITLLNIYPSIVYSWPWTITNATGVTANNYILSIFQTSYRGFERNFGLFREPGAYQTFLIIAIYFSAFYYKNINMKHLLILSLAVITTLSTTGVIGLFIILILIFLNNLDNQNTNNIILLFSFFSFLAITILIINPQDILNLIFGKLKGNAQSGSTTVRLYSFIEPLKVLYNKSIFGIGYIGLSNHAKALGYNMNTCTFTNWFGMYGIGVGIFLNYHYLKFPLFKGKKFLNVGLVLLFYVIIFSQDYASNTFIFILICYSITNSNNLKYNNNLLIDYNNNSKNNNKEHI